MRYVLLLLLLAACTPPAPEIEATVSSEFTGVNYTLEEWKERLTEEEFAILWGADTERPFTGDLLDIKEAGTYVTAGCKIPVFRSEHKFDSGTGWPSFWAPFNESNIILREEYKLGTRRVEVLSACGEHLGHVFSDGPAPTGLRYCINSAALDFVPENVT